MNNYIVDFTETKTDYEIHMVLKKGLNLPDFYGMNLDALYDMLTGYIDTSAIVYIIGLNSLSERVKKESDMVMLIFNRAKEWHAKMEHTFNFVVRS